MKRLYFILIALVTVSMANAQLTGTGIDTDPYIIANADALVELSGDKTKWGTSGDPVYVELSQDIDMTGKTFTSIGNKNQAFFGHIDGKNKMISNLTITDITTVDATVSTITAMGEGLTGSLTGSIMNLGIVNILFDGVIANGTRVGAFAGLLNASSSITNCFSHGGSITVKGGWAAGIVGFIADAAGLPEQKVQDCYSSTNITGGYGCGGIVGMNRDADVIVDRVVSYGTVSTTATNRAIMAFQNDAGNANKNGIGAMDAYYATSAGSPTDDDATALSDIELGIAANYSTFDFNSVWKISDVYDRAVLRSFPDISMALETTPVVDESSIYVSGKTLFVNDTNAASYKVFNLSGVTVAEGVVVSSAVALDVPKGLYIVKVGTTTKKVMIK